ncbi:6452_t:CDS:2, partial [Ambispora leptoticha]
GNVVTFWDDVSFGFTWTGKTRAFDLVITGLTHNNHHHTRNPRPQVRIRAKTDPNRAHRNSDLCCDIFDRDWRCILAWIDEVGKRVVERFSCCGFFNKTDFPAITGFCLSQNIPTNTSSSPTPQSSIGTVLRIVASSTPESATPTTSQEDPQQQQPSKDLTDDGYEPDDKDISCANPLREFSQSYQSTLYLMMFTLTNLYLLFGFVMALMLNSEFEKEKEKAWALERKQIISANNY